MCITPYGVFMDEWLLSYFFAKSLPILVILCNDSSICAGALLRTSFFAALASSDFRLSPYFFVRAFEYLSFHLSFSCWSRLLTLSSA